MDEKKKRKVRKLYNATAHLDGGLMDELTDSSGRNIPDGEKPKPFFKRKGAVAAVAALTAAALLVGTLTGLFLYEKSGPPAADEEPSQSMTLKAPPWKTDGLRLTSVVYRDGDTRPLAAEKVENAFRLLAAEAETPAGTDPADTEQENGRNGSGESGNETVTDSESKTESDSDRKGKTVTVSIRSDTKISAFSGSRLVRIEPKEGEHAGCDSVWYDVEKDETVCLSCRIRDAVSQTPEYLDACVRMAIESGMISREAILAAMIKDEYSALYTLLSEGTARSVFASGERPSVESLGLNGTVWDNDDVRKALARFSYPVVHVVEYGTDPEKCLYVLTNREHTLAYGTFLFNLSSDSSLQLDGSFIGETSSLNGFCLPAGDIMTNFALATDIRIDENYERIVAEVPYVMGGAHYDPETNLLTPAYAGYTIQVFTTSGYFYSVYDRHDPDAAASSPSGGLLVKGRVISFFTADGRTGFSVFDGPTYFLEGERMLVTEDVDGIPYAWMRQSGQAVCYRLGKNGPERLEQKQKEQMFDRPARCVLEGKTCLDLATGDRKDLFDSEPLALVRSSDGLFAYGYLGDGGVTCADLRTGETGFLPLDPAFEKQTKNLNDVTYCLFLNRSDDELLLAYYREGQLTFDREAYFAAFDGIRKSVHILNASTDTVNAFNHNLETVTDYYRIGGEPATLKNVPAALTLGRFLSVSLLDRRLKPEMTEAHYKEISRLLSTPDFLADVAEALIPYMEYSGTVCSVTASTLRDAMPISVETLDERYESLFVWLDSTMYFSPDLVESADLQKDLLARDIANVIIRMTTGYLAPDDLNRDDELWHIRVGEQTGDTEYTEYHRGMLRVLEDFYGRFNANLDTASAESTRRKLIERIRPLLPEPHLNAKGSGYEIRTREYDAILESVWEDVFPVACTQSYPDYIRSAAFLDDPYVGDFYSGRTASYYGALFADTPRVIDRRALKELLSGLTFEKADVYAGREAAVYCRRTPFLTAGRDADGTPWLISFGYAAALTETQFETFVSVCSGKEVVDEAFMEDGTYYLYYRASEAFQRDWIDAHSFMESPEE